MAKANTGVSVTSASWAPKQIFPIPALAPAASAATSEQASTSFEQV